MNKRKKWSKERIGRFLFLMLMALSLLAPMSQQVFAQEDVCAEVKIVIEQKLSLERQAFDARMVIRNGLTSSLENVSIELLFWDQDMQAVVATQDPNMVDAKFFYRVDSLSGIDSINGQGSVDAKTSAEIHWLAIPAAGAAGNSGALYYLGAKVTYTVEGQESVVDVTPDYIVVNPLPMLTLDYFLPVDVYADDAFTPETEPAVPFTLGVRIKNSGEGVSSKTMIESAQPRIIENDLNLLIGFEILGGYVSDEPAGKSLLLDFGDIAAHTSKVGRWNMVTTLSGKFLEFTATYSHADSLGGALTSLIQDIHTHMLVHDVKVGLPGRDNVRDFLAFDDDVLRVYESDGVDTEVENLSDRAQLDIANGYAKVNVPATSGFVFIQVADPYQGQQVPVNALRSDGKALPAENIWLSKTRNNDQSWSYFINIFDSDTTGAYTFRLSADVKAALFGTVYEDMNGDGLQGMREAGLAVVEVTLDGIDEVGSRVLATAYTDAQGKFSFTELNPGRYGLKVGSVNGMTDGIALSVIEGSVAQPGQISDMALGAGASVQGIFFAKRSSTSEAVSGDVDLLVAALGSSSLTPHIGDQIVVTAMFGNAGAELANDVMMNISLPDGVSLVRSAATVGSFVDGEWMIGSVRPYEIGLLQLTLRIDRVDDVMSFAANIGGAGIDSDLSNNTATLIL